MIENHRAQHPVFRRFTSLHNPLNQCLYNSPHIDSPKVVWATGMGPTHNLELLHYYANRKVSMVVPGSIPAVVSPYASPPGIGC
jgi:hypothetical protein